MVRRPISRLARAAAASASLDPAVYRKLADFRYLLRRFLAFSEASASAASLTPRQHGSSANRLEDKAGRYGRPALPALSRCQHRVPDGRRTSIFEAQAAEVELSLVDPPQQLNASNRDRRGPKPFEPEHRIDA